MKTKYVVYHINPIGIYDNRSDAEEIMLSLAEEGAYEAFCEVMYRPWYNPRKSNPPVYDLVSYFMSAEYWNKRHNSRLSVNATLLFNGISAWRIVEVIDYSEDNHGTED